MYVEMATVYLAVVYGLNPLIVFLISDNSGFVRINSFLNGNTEPILLHFNESKGTLNKINSPSTICLTPKAPAVGSLITKAFFPT